jgi:hypothetical protein
MKYKVNFSKKIILSFLLIVIFNIYPIFAQSKKEAKLITAVEDLKKAMISGDSVQLEKLVSPKLGYGHSGGHVDTKAEFIHKLATGQSDFITIDLTEQSTVFEKNIGIVRHVLSATTNDNNKQGQVKLKVLLIWQFKKGNWKLIARQAVKI